MHGAFSAGLIRICSIYSKILGRGLQRRLCRRLGCNHFSIHVPYGKPIETISLGKHQLNILDLDGLRAMLDREAKVQKAAALLYTHCIEPDKERVSRTGSVLPTQSLRHKATRDLLTWTRELAGARCFTHALMRDSLEYIAKAYALELPAVPGFSVRSWAQDEAAVIHPILKRSRKSTARELSEPAAPDPEAMADDAETQQWSCYDVDPFEDWD